MKLKKWLKTIPRRIAYVVYCYGECKTESFLDPIKDRHLDTDIYSLDKVTTAEWNEKSETKFSEKDFDFVWIIRLERMKIYD